MKCSLWSVTFLVPSVKMLRSRWYEKCNCVWRLAGGVEDYALGLFSDGVVRAVETRRFSLGVELLLSRMSPVAL